MSWRGHGVEVKCPGGEENGKKRGGGRQSGVPVLISQLS